MDKILFLDIENSPNLGYIWGKYEQDVISFKQEWYMLSFAYKWLGDRRVKSVGLPDFKLYKKEKTNDRELVGALWKLLDEAEIVIMHNGDAFDVRKSNARFLFHGFTPPAPYRTVDTLKWARKYFFLNSNKLDDIVKYLGLGEKVKTGGFDLWLGCMSGDKKAWKQMLKYNAKDVDLLESVYNKLRSWSDNHPNVNIVDEKKNACPICGSTKIQKSGFRMTRVGKYQRFLCNSCGGWSHGKTIKIKDFYIR